MNISTVNWVSLCGFHSQLTGVLAGFIFAAMTLLLTSHENQVNHDQKKPLFSAVLYTLLIVFSGLILSSFLFAATTGDTDQPDRAAYRAIVASLAFAVSIPLMFTSLAWLFTIYGIDDNILRNTYWLARILTLASGFYLITSVTHMGPANDPFRTHHLVTWRPWLIWSAVIIPFLGWGLHLLRNKTLETNEDVLRGVTNFGGGLIIVISGYYGYVSDLSPVHFSSLGLCISKYASLVVLGIYLYFCGIAVPCLKTSKKQIKSESSQALIKSEPASKSIISTT